VWRVLLSCLAMVVATSLLCALTYGLALGLFSRNLGLVGGIVSAGCYLIVSVSMAVVGVLPERSQAPRGRMYIACGTGAFGLVVWALAGAGSGRATERVRDMTTKEQ
jgi:DHA1 family bicyclomycin/chloramphenicol resistance-like MFS transporter